MVHVVTGCTTLNLSMRLLHGVMLRRAGWLAEHVLRLKERVNRKHMSETDSRLRSHGAAVPARFHHIRLKHRGQSTGNRCIVGGRGALLPTDRLRRRARFRPGSVVRFAPSILLGRT